MTHDPKLPLCQVTEAVKIRRQTRKSRPKLLRAKVPPAWSEQCEGNSGNPQNNVQGGAKGGPIDGDFDPAKGSSGGPTNGIADARLRIIIERWPDLPEGTKAALIRLVAAG